MLQNIFIFACSLALVIKGATFATKYASRLAKSFHLSKYTVGFIVVAIISILPETFIAINSALTGMPSFGLGVLFGSNIADLTLVFTVILLFAGRRIKIESKVIDRNKVYSFFLLLPVILGLDGYFSRLEGLALIIVGAVFYYMVFRNDASTAVAGNSDHSWYKSLILLVVGMAVLLIGSYFTVISALALAQAFNINPILIGMLVVGLGTTIPELFFALKAVRKKDDSLAVGDVLGTVLADATIVVGILALLNPFSFPQKIIYITGVFMVLASAILLIFMRSGKVLSRKEGIGLLFFWLAFVFIEFWFNK
ncbi:MAG: sodium:calcium antiporter [Candidatus Magasanikbacteria bacterium]|nr:sodium:calcium antiporter [Candidatus Magasanikbacteria bacterium]